MRSQLYSLGVAGLLAASFVSFSAHANSNGITGRSGKQSLTCMTAGCHATNPSPTAPTVELQGPTTLAAGATGNYSIVITGGPAVKAGMNVAVSNNGGTLAAGADTKLVGGELTHTAAKNFASNVAKFDFTLVAPAAAGTVTLFGSGNSSNGNSANTGDNAVAVTLPIQITASSTPDAGTPDAGTPDAGPGKGDGDGAVAEESGCSAAGGAPMVLLLALVAAHLRRRRD